jgi:hypothetical protein
LNTEYKVREICLGDGLYNFTIRDEYGDGMCCRYGHGFFHVSFNDQTVLAGRSFNANVTEVLNIGFKPKSGVISEREHQYLLSHNIREVFSGVGEGCQGLGGGVVCV